MAIQKPTKAQVTAAITTVVGILILITTALPITDNVKLYIGFAIGVIGIIGNVYGVYRVPNGISPKADATELLTAASVLTNIAVSRTTAAAIAAPKATPVAPVVFSESLVAPVAAPVIPSLPPVFPATAPSLPPVAPASVMDAPIV